MSYFENTKIQFLIDQAKLTIFDMNGTILDDESLHFEATKKVHKKYGIDVSEQEWFDYCLGRPAYEHIKEIFVKHGLYLDKAVLQGCVVQKQKEYQKLLIHRLQKIVRPGVKSFLEYLKAQGKIVALATSSTDENVEIILGEKGLQLKENFSFILTGDHVKKHKPNPEAFLTVAHQLGVKPKDCIVIEDSQTGVQAAVNAEMPCICFPNEMTKHMDLSQATVCVSSLEKNAKIVSY